VNRDAQYDALKVELEESEKQIMQGKSYSQEEVMKKFGLL
jgi:hypothetical protein